MRRAAPVAAGRRLRPAAITALLTVAIGVIGSTVAADHGTDGAALAALRVHTARVRAAEASHAVIDAQARIALMTDDIAAAERRLATTRAALDAPAPWDEQPLGNLVLTGAANLATLIDRGPPGDRADPAPTDAAITAAGVVGDVPDGAEADLDAAFGESDVDLRHDLEFAQREVEALNEYVAAARLDVVALAAAADEAIAQLAAVEQHHLPDPAIEAELSRLELDRAANGRAAEAVAVVAARALADPGDGAGGTGTGDEAPEGIVCPLDGDHTFVNTFGAPRSGGRRHQGVDMMAAAGTTVVAVESGVANFKNSRLGGRAVWLTGDSGTTYYYAHLRDWEGSSRVVERGEVIGSVGTTGNAFTPHLHFEIHPGGGAAVSPYRHVDTAC